MRYLMIAAGLALASPLQAATFNIDWSGLNGTGFTAGTDSFSQTVNGVTVTARGYSVSVENGAGAVTGPLAATDVSTCTNLNPALCPGGRANGLRLSIPGLGIRDAANTALGLNGYLSAGVSVTEFIAFDFSLPVSIGSVVVDDVSNFGRSIWYASGDATPNFSAGFAPGLGALGGVANSGDDATDGLFSHALGLSDITTLLVGAPFFQDAFAGISAARTNFYIASFGNVDLSDAGTDGGSGGDPMTPVTPIPLPAGGLMLAGALGLLIRRR